MILQTCFWILIPLSPGNILGEGVRKLSFHYWKLSKSIFYLDEGQVIKQNHETLICKESIFASNFLCIRWNLGVKPKTKKSPEI